MVTKDLLAQGPEWIGRLERAEGAVELVRERGVPLLRGLDLLFSDFHEVKSAGESISKRWAEERLGDARYWWGAVSTVSLILALERPVAV